MSIQYRGEVSNVQSVRFREFAPTVLGGNNRDLLRTVHALEPGTMALRTSRFDGLDSTSVALARFVKNNQFSKGREQSAHQVFFGQLILQTLRDQEIPLHIAAKPYNRQTVLFDTPAKSIVHEWAANEYVNRFNPPQAFEPIGLWKNEAGEPQLLTKFEEDVQSFDNVFWARGKTARQTKPERVADSLGKCLYALGVLHGMGLYMGDAQVKNFARNARTVRYNDLEMLQPLPLGADNTVIPLTESRRFIASDVHMLAGSTVDQTEQPNDMQSKVFKVIRNATIVYQAGKQYIDGVRTGSQQSGVVVPDAFVIEPERMIQVFTTAADIQDRE